MKKNKFDKYFPYLLITPSIVTVILIMFIPLVYVFNLSLQNFSYIGLTKNGYIGLKNFRTIFFEDELFFSTLLITIKWVVCEVSLQIIFGLFVALLLNIRFKGNGAVRAMVFVPWAVSGVLTTMLWSLMYNQHIGLLNDLFIKLGIIDNGVAWLANEKTVFPSVVVAELWRGMPLFAISILAALKSIPGDIYESCAIDGCTGFKRFVFITLPYIKGTILFTSLLRIIWEFTAIDMIFTMTNGGPMHLTTTLPIYLMQTAVIKGNYGYGSALAVSMFVLLLLFSMLYLKLYRNGSEVNE